MSSCSSRSEAKLETTEQVGWHRTSPFAAVFYAGRFLRGIARNALQSLAPIAAFMVAFEGDPMRNLALAVAGLASFIIVSSFLRYWFFRYAIVGDSILIRDGILNRKQLDIGFDRIQAVNTRQNILYRLLGLTTVTFDSAGSSAEEGSLPAVGVEVADDLRARIRRTPRRHVERDAAGSRISDDEPIGEAGDAAGGPSSARTLMRLGARDIVLAGLASGRVFLLLAVLGPLGELAEREIGDLIEETTVFEAVSSFRPDAATGALLVLAVVAGVIVLLLLISVVGAFLRYHRYSLTTDGDVMRSTGGLFTRHEHSVARAKVQSISVSQNVLLRLFDRYSLRVRQVTAGAAGNARDFVVPVSRGGDLHAVGEEIFRDEVADLALDPRGAAFERVSPHYIRSRFILFGLLPASGVAALMWPSVGAAALIAFSWLPVCALAAWQSHRRLGFSVARDGLAFRRGLLGSRVVVWLHRKVQRVSIRQSPFQRRAHLATLRLHLAAGSVRIPFIDYDKACRLRDYVLYRVESSPLPWH